MRLTEEAKTPKQLEKELGESEGFEAIPNNYAWWTFKRGPMVVWKIRFQGGIGWQTAALIDGYYRDHQPFKKLEDALRHAWLEAWTRTGETA